jgi:hypothetical protein
MMPKYLVPLYLFLILMTLSCGEQTWEADMEAGDAALQRREYRHAEQIFAAAVHKAEEFGGDARSFGPNI